MEERLDAELRYHCERPSERPGAGTRSRPRRRSRHRLRPADPVSNAAGKRVCTEYSTRLRLPHMPDPAIREEVGSLVMRAIEKESAGRFQSAQREPGGGS